MSNPTMFVVNTSISFVGLIAMFIHQKLEKLFPIAWAILAAGVLTTLNLATGTFGFDAWASGVQISEAIFNGKSGLCLLVVGACVAGLNSGLLKLMDRPKDPRAFRIQGWIAGGSIILVGCLIALIASFMNRDNTFDVMTASSLLLVAAAGLIAVCVAYK